MFRHLPSHLQALEECRSHRTVFSQHPHKAPLGRIIHFHNPHPTPSISIPVRSFWSYLASLIDHDKPTAGYTRCPGRNVPDFGRMFLKLKYTDITQNTYILSWTVTEIMVKEVWNYGSCYTLIDYQIHIKTGRNMWFL